MAGDGYRAHVVGRGRGPSYASTFVLVLRPDANDKGWAPAVVNETLDGRTYARFTWLHPECLEHLETDPDGCVVIGHADRRRSHMASHALGDWDPRVRRYRGGLVLDARWSGLMNTGICKSYCTAYAAELVRRYNRMADILEFAIQRASDTVACNFATHRPVGAGNVLEHFFSRT